MLGEEHFRKLERMYASAPINALLSALFEDLAGTGGGGHPHAARVLAHGWGRSWMRLLQSAGRRDVLCRRSVH